MMIMEKNTEYLLTSLSSIVIEFLKEHSRTQGQINSQILSSSLIRDESVRQLFESYKGGDANGGFNGNGGRTVHLMDAPDIMGDSLPDSYINELIVKEAKSIYLELLSKIPISEEGERAGELAHHRKRLESCRNHAQISELKEKIFTFIKTYTQRLIEENTRATEFMNEIGEYLMEIQGFVSNSSQNAFKSNVTYNNLLEKQIINISHTVEHAEPAKVKEQIVEKVRKIRSFIDNKRKLDENRLEEAQKEIHNLKRSLSRISAEMELVRQHTDNLEHEILLDHLTGTYNRRATEQILGGLFDSYAVDQVVFCLALIDVDHFKRINDNYGHVVGDKCLQEISRKAKSVLRTNDYFCRFGGEEFLAILPGTKIEGGVSTAEKLRKAIEETTFLYQNQAIKVTVSAGVAEVDPTDFNVEALLNRVDLAMYDAKRDGRNQVRACSACTLEQPH